MVGGRSSATRLTSRGNQKITLDDEAKSLRLEDSTGCMELGTEVSA